MALETVEYLGCVHVIDKLINPSYVILKKQLNLLPVATSLIS